MNVLAIDGEMKRFNEDVANMIKAIESKFGGKVMVSNIEQPTLKAVLIVDENTYSGSGK